MTIEGTEEWPRGMVVRLWALETMLTWLVASQHMQSWDPKEAMRRVKDHLLASDWPLAELPEDLRDTAREELRRLADRIDFIQQELPRRLID